MRSHHHMENRSSRGRYSHPLKVHRCLLYRDSHPHRQQDSRSRLHPSRRPGSCMGFHHRIRPPLERRYILRRCMHPSYMGFHHRTQWVLHRCILRPGTIPAPCKSPHRRGYRHLRQLRCIGHYPEHNFRLYRGFHRPRRPPLIPARPHTSDSSMLYRTGEFPDTNWRLQHPDNHYHSNNCRRWVQPHTHHWCNCPPTCRHCHHHTLPEPGSGCIR